MNSMAEPAKKGSDFTLFSEMVANSIAADLSGGVPVSALPFPQLVHAV